MDANILEEDAASIFRMKVNGVKMQSGYIQTCYKEGGHTIIAA
jgi:hypothetical protein